ncbi:MAG: hypothetical protein U0R51_03620 [Solirubrobacterales bacterium]
MKTSARLAAVTSALFVVLTGALPPAAGLAAERPTCGGEKATIVGTAGKDAYAPSKFHPGDVVALLGGNDYAQVGGHVDDVTVCGGQGEDEIVADAGAGRDLRFFGGGGADVLGSLFEQGKRAAQHSFRLDGGRGLDYFHGSRAHDRIDGGPGPDRIDGYLGGDVLHGDGGDDLVEGGPGADTLFGDHDDDALYGYYYSTKTPNAERLDSAFGGPGRDVCVAADRHSCRRDRR